MNSAALQQQKKLAAALKRLNRTEQILCFDPANLSSRPTKEQLRVIDAVREQEVNVLAVLGGNQSGKCLISQTKILTPNGPVNIEDLSVGDIVYSEDGKEIKVKDVIYQGKQTVYPLTRGKKVIAHCTANHRWLPKGKEQCERAENLDSDIERVTVKSSLGSSTFKQAYALGALLGDGCRAPNHQGVLISSETELIPNRVAQDIPNAQLSKVSGDNYTWEICSRLRKGNRTVPIQLPHYTAWCKYAHAHTKIADLDVIKTWDRESCIKFIAGLIDTDGSLYSSKSNQLVLNFTTQAPQIKEAISWLFLALWQVQLSWQTDKREKYVNGPCYSFKITHINELKLIYNELDAHLVTPRKRWSPEYDTFKSRQFKCRLRYDRPIEADTWDIEVESDTHLFLLANGYVSHNSNTGARILSWMFEENFPEWDRHPRWGEEPLLFLVIAQTLKQAEESLWRRIEGFLEPGSYIVNKVGGIINKVTHKKNGNVILFFSHDNPNEARKRIQSFTAHFAWVDELPGNVKLIEEVQRRVQARSGQMLMTFTPKAPTPDIKRYVEQLQEPYGQRYVLKALDNPAYTKEDKKKLMESLKSFSDKYKATILEGAWVQPEEMVYEFDYDTMVEAPPNYSPSWRHVESSDPALSSAHGLIVAAEEPNSGVWYIIRADYLREMLVPEKLIAEVVSRTGGVNLVRRIADPHEVWYIQTAATKGLQYVSPYKKNERKHELIKNLQAALGHRVKIAPWCQSLIDEIQTCHWSETAENKIAKGSRFHLLDAAQYAVDCLPKYEAGQVPQPWYAELRIANQKRKEQKAAALKRPPRPYKVIKRRRRW